MFGWSKSRRRTRGPEPGPLASRIPTVKFDPTRLTDAVLLDLKESIRALPEVGTGDFEAIYQAAFQAISAGGALHILSAALMTIDDMTMGRAGDISRLLHFRAMAIMNAEKQMKLGIMYATWRYSGAPCRLAGGEEQDAAHKAANGKPYLVSKGMFLNGEWTWPGYQEGCKCISKSMIPGINGYDGEKPKGLVE